MLSLQIDNEGTSDVPKRHTPVVLNTKPPSGVATANLEEVNFEFKFHYVPSKKTKSKKQKRGTHDPFSSRLSAWTCYKRVERCNSTSQPDPVLPSFIVDSELDLIESASQPLASTYWEEMLDNPTILTDQGSVNAAKRLGFLDLPGSNSEPELTVTINQNQRKRILPNHNDRRYQPNALTILKLLDVGMRTAISSSRVQSCPGIMLNKKSKGPKLAEIAPVLFSPGYRQVCSPYRGFAQELLTRVQAISYRNHLLPSIVQSISAVYRHTKSADLREKMERLCGEPSEVLSLPDGHMAYCGTQDLDAAVRARLWVAAQRSLFDPSGTRKLRVFDLSSPVSQLWHDKDEILDTDSPHHLPDDFGTSTLQDGTEDEDLLLSSDLSPDELLDQVYFSEEDVEELLLDFEEDGLLQDEGPHEQALDVTYQNGDINPKSRPH